MESTPGSSQGGSDTPTETVSLNVRQFVAARVAEISSLTAQISAGGGVQGRGKGFSFQHVSKHMRRRAVSHNPKRLPSRLRAIHLAQLRKSSGGVVKKPKRPRKRYRKRSDGDILEYNRRQLVNPKWLESHIWHAKRFHMKLMWERKLAYAPTAKCFRSLFRATRHGVIMQDMSFLSVMELSGPLTTLVEGMRRLIPSGFRTIPLWNRELLGHMFSHEKTKYLGAIKYLWIETQTTTEGKLLLWVHPAIKANVAEEIQKEFGLVGQEVVIKFPEFPNKDEKKHLWKIVNNQMWANNDSSMKLKDLSGCLNRIRLVGPRTLPVLKDVLKLGQLLAPSSEELKPPTLDQDSVWKSIQKISLIPDNTVVSINVIDPRRELPKKRRLVKRIVVEADSVGNIPFHSQWPQFKQDSPLWHEDVRKWVLQNKTSDDQLSRARSKNLIPGTAIEEEKEPDVIPIVLVFRSNYSGMPGVDLIVPCGWLMAFWIALSYRCVRSYAMEFNDYLTFEENPHLLDFSSSARFAPDSIACERESQKTEKEVRTKYFSYPPAKRQNLIKLGCAFPFSTDWACFMAFLSAQSEQDKPFKVQVLRKQEDLRIVSKCLRDMTHNHEIFLQSHVLLPVTVVLISGTVERGACICLPTAEDLQLHASGQYNQVHILQQPWKDINDRKRAELSRQHHKRLSHLRKKRKLARRAALGFKKDFDLKARLEELDSKAAVDKYNQEMNSLWLIDNPQEVLAQQDREIMGFTDYGHFSFVRGKSAASGYVTLGHLKKLLELRSAQLTSGKGKRTLHVLVRNWASSLTYHWAKLEYPS